MNYEQRQRKLRELAKRDTFTRPDGSKGCTCYLCGVNLRTPGTRLGVAPTIDHVLPKSRGGTNKTKNLRLACEPCNGAKANLLLTEL